MEHDSDGLTVTGPGRVEGVDLDLGDVGELAPVLAAVCALASTPSRLRGIAHLRHHETDRLAALATEITALGGDVRETDDGLVIVRRPLHGGVVSTYDDHRLATMAAVLGLCVPGLEVADVATTAKTMPGFVGLWTGMLGERGDPARAAATWTRTTSGSGPAAGRDRARRTGPPTRTPSPGIVVAVDRGRITCGSADHEVVAMKARELGRSAASWSATGWHWSATCPARPTPWPGIVRVEPRTSTLRRTADDTDPFERVIVANADQLVDRDGPRRPGAAAAADRPVPGGGVRRGSATAAVPDQVRPRVARGAARDLPARSTSTMS